MTLKKGDLIILKEEIRYIQDHCFFTHVFPKTMIFEVDSFKNDHVVLKADGYGDKKNYGNGSLHLWYESDLKGKYEKLNFEGEIIKVNENEDLEIYNTNRHITEKYSLHVDRFKFNDQPTCMSWAGSKNIKREICMFLGSKHFGTEFVCMVNQEKIFTYENSTTLKPIKSCIMWSKS
jgi:hypothetical protein